MNPSSSSSSSSSKVRHFPPLPPCIHKWTEVNDFDLRVMTDEELEAYYREVEASEGFDVVTMPDASLCGGIVPVNLNTGMFSSIKEGAIKDYNLKNIEEATTEGSCGLRFYITLKAKPIDTPADYPTTTFQAKVIYYVKGLTIEICRIKASN